MNEYFYVISVNWNTQGKAEMEPVKSGTVWADSGGEAHDKIMQHYKPALDRETTRYVVSTLNKL